MLQSKEFHSIRGSPMRQIISFLFLSLLLALTGCTTTQSPNVVSSGAVTAQVAPCPSDPLEAEYLHDLLVTLHKVDPYSKKTGETFKQFERVLNSFGDVVGFDLRFERGRAMYTIAWRTTLFRADGTEDEGDSVATRRVDHDDRWTKGKVFRDETGDGCLNAGRRIYVSHETGNQEADPSGTNWNQYGMAEGLEFHVQWQQAFAQSVSALWFQLYEMNE